jgi:mannosyl-3-phosphoglycerate phosphatase family protein
MIPTDLVVFSDLDGTLLDHDSYSFAPAKPALQLLAQRRVPLILATSKTLPETRALSAALDNPAPVIVENGAAIAIPLAQRDAYPLNGEPSPRDGYLLWHLAADYRRLRDFLQRERGRHGYRVEGFGDMQVADVISLTGLDSASAARAMLRCGSEPLVWRDHEERLQTFHDAARREGLQLTRGGRFWHLMGTASKAIAIQRVLDSLAGQGRDPATIALGDSDNDRAMLESVDIAVLVRRPDGTWLNDCRGRGQTWRTGAVGPEGWNRAILQLLRNGRVAPRVTDDGQPPII